MQEPNRFSLAVWLVAALIGISQTAAACGPAAPSVVVRPSQPPLGQPTNETSLPPPAPGEWQVVSEPEWGYEIALPQDWMVVLATADDAARAELARRFPRAQSEWLQSVTAYLGSQGRTLRWVAVLPQVGDRQVEWELLPGVLDEQTSFDEWIEKQRSEAATVGPSEVKVEEVHGPTHAMRISAYDGLSIQIYLARGVDVWELALLCCGEPPDDVAIQGILDSYRLIQ
jgi:hypothetical protein